MTPYWGSVKSIDQVGNGRGGGLVSGTVPWELPVGRKTGKDRKKIL